MALARGRQGQRVAGGERCAKRKIEAVLAYLGESAREASHLEGVGVEASQRDELPHEALLGQLALQVLDLLVAHAGGVPVERGRQVVSEELVGDLLAHGAGELAGFGDAGSLGKGEGRSREQRRR